MNLDRSECQASPLSVMPGTVMPVPQQENISIVLDHAQAQADTALKYVTMMLSHVGGGAEADKDEPATPGILGKAFALRSQLQRLNGRLEALGKLL